MSDVSAFLNADTLQLGTFIVGGEEFGVDILKLREIIRIMPITKVPCADGFVEGAINLRGQIIPIINLRKRFGLPGKEFDRDTRIINMEVNNFVVGFIVDSVGQVRRISGNLVEPAPAVVATVDSEYINGVAKIEDRLLILLDMGKLVSDELLQSLVQL